MTLGIRSSWRRTRGEAVQHPMDEQAQSVTHVSIERFGKDHWSLLAYIETCCVDSAQEGIGTLDNRRMRCHPKHPKQHIVVHGAGGGWQESYGTRLRGFFGPDNQTHPEHRLPDHDDWDCLDDIEAAGLVEVLNVANGFVRMTPAGIEVAAALRKHKALGGTLASFDLKAASAP